MRNSKNNIKPGSTRKGSFGYIRAERGKVILFDILLYAAAFGIFFGARAYFGTNRNLFSIVAILIFLPAAHYTVNLVMLFRATPCSQEAHRQIEEHVGNLDSAYDLYMTGEKKSFAVSHLAVGGKNIACFTEDAKCDTAAAEQHLQTILKANGYHGYRAKWFTSLPKYLDRLDQLNGLASEEESRGHEELMQLVKAISL